jgi:hypothetical protein
MSNAARALIGIAAIAVVVVLFVVLRGSDDDSDSDADSTRAATSTAEETTDQGGQGGQKPDGAREPAEPEVPTIVIKDGQPAGGVQELEFTEGEDIRFVVDSDVSEEVHFHGYDVAKEVEAGGEVEFDVPATLTGQFEVELEHSVVPIAEITVNPS